MLTSFLNSIPGLLKPLQKPPIAHLHSMMRGNSIHQIVILTLLYNLVRPERRDTGLRQAAYTWLEEVDRRPGQTDMPALRRWAREVVWPTVVSAAPAAPPA